MSDKPDPRRMKEELDKDSRDVSDLWNEALKKYKGIVGVDLQQKDGMRSVDDMVKFGTEQMNNFHKFRHDQKKVDKLRSLLRDNLGYIEKGAQQLAAAATPAFPPAAAIGTAVTYMLQACRSVSADYDVVTAFFEDMNSFLQRISILESRLPKEQAYRNCLMDVFTSLLEMCGFATKYIELGRFKKWVINMIQGQDGDLGGARKKMDTSLKRLQSATEYAILGNTVELQRMNAELQKNQELQTQIMQSQTRMLENVLESQDAVRNDLSNIQKLLIVFNEHRKEDSSKQAATKPTGAKNKPPTSNRVRNFFENTTGPSREYDAIKESFIPDTGTWIFDEPVWNKWVAQEKDQESPRVLAITGPPGSGKSHLATSAYNQLTKLAERDPTGNTCVAHFFFREMTEDTNLFYNAVNWIVIQIAEQNAALCEKLNVEIVREDLEINKYNWFDTWRKLVKPLFGGASNFRLQVVLDGLDEIFYDQETENAFEFLSMVQEAEDMNVTVVYTARPTLSEKVEGVGGGSIEVTKDKQLSDIKTLIWNHLNNDNGLKKLSRYIKQRISSKLEEKADGILYAEHILRQYNSVGRGPLVLKLLDEMPENLEVLYDSMTSDLQRHNTPEQQKSMQAVLGWLAFSYRSMTLAETKDLVKLVPGSSFDLEEELQGHQLSRFLRLADSEERVPSEPDFSTDTDVLNNAQTKSGEAYDDEDLPIRFQGRSMRDYFRNAEKEEKGLRTPRRIAEGSIFTVCARILSGDISEVSLSLKKYAAQYWLWHFSWWLSIGWTSPAGDDEKATCLGLFGEIITNSKGFATVIESLDLDYHWIRRWLPKSELLDHTTAVADLVLPLEETFDETTVKWAREVSENKEAAFLPLLRAHVIKWHQAEDMASAVKSFRIVRSMISWTSFEDYIEHDEHDPEDDDYATHETEIVFLANVFEDISLDAQGHLAVAYVMSEFNRHEAALLQCRVALDKSPDEATRFRILGMLATTQHSLGSNEDALASITDCLSYRDVPNSLLRRALVNRGQIQAALNKLDDAIASYEEARLVDPNEPMRGEFLQEEFNVYDKKRADPETVAVVKRWKPLERLAWMTWNYNNVKEHHFNFRRAAGRAGEQEFLVKAYEEVITLLDAVDAAAPLKVSLARAHWLVSENVVAAKSLLNDVLDGSSDGNSYRFTNEDPAYVLTDALLLMTDIIYDQFRASTDRDTKAKLFAEAKDLTHRSLALSVTYAKSELMPRNIVLARMARKMGPVEHFQGALEAAFAQSYDALTDNVGWNDTWNLTSLATVISNLDGLERESEILMSCMPYVLQTKEPEEHKEVDLRPDGEDETRKEGNEDSGPAEKQSDQQTEVAVVNGDTEDDNDNDIASVDEGNFVDMDYLCDGECEPFVNWKNWEIGPMYHCLICNSCNLCEPCYEKRQAQNKGAKPECGTRYCGPNHKYIKGPIEGWQGVSGGVIRIKGEEPIKFVDWLAELKDKKWKAAWDRFWTSEE